MATKQSVSLFSKSNQKNSISNGDPQFTNLNLNQTNKSSDFCSVSSKHKSSDNNKIQNNASSKNQKVLTTTVESTTKNSSLTFGKTNKNSHILPSDYSNNSHDEEKLKDKNDSNKISSSSNSTLSLHITAYENNVEAGKIENQSESCLSETTVCKNIDGGKTWKNVKKLFENETKNQLYEIPRQQKEEENEPEIMQFKASQKLLNPNQPSPSMTEFEKLKENANKLFKEEKYNEAVKSYTKILQLPGISSKDQAIIYSNRSASYLMFGGRVSMNQAKTDAEKAIKLWPSWWKAYFRLARVQMNSDEWFEAEETLNQAMALNSESKEIRDELSFVRSKIGKITREEHLNPDNWPLSREEEVKKVCTRTGISENEYDDVLKNIHMFPEYENMIKGHDYRDGNGVPQNYKKAAEHYLKAAELGNSEGMYNLGKLYHDGNGVKRDYDESMKWFLKAANSKPLGIMEGSGIAEAQHSIGLNYTEGVGVDKDYEKAAEWYEKAVKNGFAGSANNLGNFYKYGLGVVTSPKTAFYYYKFAAERGETAAMINLADCYFTSYGTGAPSPNDEDFGEGIKWLRIASDKGDIRATEELRRSENFSSTDILLDQKRNLFAQKTTEKRNPLDRVRFGKYVEEAAKKGSVTAQRHMKIWKNLDDSMDAFKRNDPKALVTALAAAIRLNNQIIKIPPVLQPLIKARIKMHPNELDAIVCYIQIDEQQQSLKKYISDAYEKFPNDEYLAEMKALNCAIFGDPKDAQMCIEMAHKRNPKSLRLLLCRGIVTSMQQPKTEELITALDDFLAVAPEDDPNVPEFYYYKAQFYALFKNNQKFLEFYEAGLAAEKKQLPNFLPYKCIFKGLLETIYLSLKTAGSESPNQSNENGSPSFLLNRIKDDPKRKILLLQNRELFISYAETFDSGISFPRTIPRPPCTPHPPNWSSPTLKQIYLKDMDPTKDQVYNGCVLHVRIIDWPILVYGIQTKIEDENGDVNRFAIYNWPMTFERKRNILMAMKTFRPNVIIAIINPYHRMSKDGQNTIRVEGPQYASINNSMIDKLCHVCGKEGKTLPSCSGCKMALYCSKECQKLDWTEFNHKGICKHLKKYATLM